MTDRRSKSNVTSLGLDEEGTARGILLGNLVTDLALMWPKYRRVAMLESGREWKVIAATPGAGGTLTVQGGVQPRANADDFVVSGDVLELTRVKATEIFTSTPLTVTAVATTFVSGAYQVTFTFAETVPALALDGHDFIGTSLVRNAPWQTWDIVSHTTGTDSDVVIDATTGQLTGVPDVALCDCDLFKCQDLVEISDRGDAGKNNGIFECRADLTDNTTTWTVHLDGVLDTIASGSLGKITLLLPTPLRVVRTARAVLRAHSIALSAGNVVRLRRNDDQHDFWEIQTPADVGPPQWFSPVSP